MSNTITLSNNAVTVKSNRTITTSLAIAKEFNKRHTDILRAITNRISRRIFALAGISETAKDWIKETSYLDEQGKTRKMYELTKDGFIFVVMGLTGEKADAIKIAYINEFNRMTNALESKKPINPDPFDPTPAIDLIDSNIKNIQLAMHLYDVAVKANQIKSADYFIHLAMYLADHNPDVTPFQYKLKF